MTNQALNMRLDPVRRRIVELTRQQGTNLAQLSRLLGRNHAYLQQFIRRGTPKRLPEDVRRDLARILAVPESELGASNPNRTSQNRPAISSSLPLNTFASRLEAARQNSLYRTAAEFSQATDIDYLRYIELETGEEDPSIRELDHISQVARISLDWLIRGDGFDSREDDAKLELPKHGLPRRRTI